MSKSLLDLTSLNNAISQLEQGLAAANIDTKDQLKRDGVIQRFEYTYELSHKMLKRFLEATEASPGTIEEMSFPNLVRTASERGLLLHGWDKWSDYRTKRGTTSHTYDAKKAAEVFAIIPAFLEDVRHLRDQITKRQRQE